MHKSFKRLMLAAVLVASANMAIAQQADMPAPEVFQKGDQWEWRQFDNRTKLEEGKRTRTVVDVDGVAMFRTGRTNFQVSAAFLGNPRASKPWRVWPLEVGKKWSYDEDFSNAGGLSWNTKQDAEVVAYEEVTTPAGKFMAFKIEYKGFFRNNRGESGRQTGIHWYAPEVYADVKQIHDDGYNMWTRELTAYKRAAP